MGVVQGNDDLPTRVFVSGLPPAFTSVQLRQHFSAKFPVTDAHVIADRRIGFVGFSNHDVAQKASSYFDRSFIRMSKISVELARPVEVRQNSYGQAAPISERSNDKHSQKRKRRSEDDGQIQRREHNNILESGARGKGAAVDNTARKSKPMQQTPGPEPQSEINVALPEDASTTSTKPLGVQSDEVSHEEPPRSDLEWLRGKTNRVLDLVDTTDNQQPQVTGESRLDGQIEVAVERESSGEASGGEDTAVDTQSSSVKIPNARLFIRNLPFDTTEEDIRRAFAPFGRLSEIHLVRDARTSTGKGLGFVQYVEPDNAATAMQNLDGNAFHGRLLHILPASDKKAQKLDDYEMSKLPLKQQKALKRKSEAATSTFSWNSLYMNPDAVLASVADRLGVSKAELLDPSSADAAVKQAQAETGVIQETKEYLRINGVNVDAFQNRDRDDRTLLLKNFPYGTTTAELTEMLSPFGEVERLLLPSTGTMAIVQYREPHAATQALKGLAYRNIKGSPLFLEKGPQGLLSSAAIRSTAPDDKSQADVVASNEVESPTGATVTVFVRNLNFSTSTARLGETFKPLSGFLSARVKTRTEAKRPGEILSMGFGFVEFKTKGQAEAAITTMNGRRLDGHEILVQASRGTLDAGEERRQADLDKKLNAHKTKIIIKNLPFEASKKDIRSLFSAYGQLRSVRMPKKSNNSTRGFAFADFVTAKEARNAMDSLSSTHLLGRRLVLDFAEAESVDPEQEILAMEKKVGHQAYLSTVNKMMAGSARKKFDVDARDDTERA